MLLYQLKNNIAVCKKAEGQCPTIFTGARELLAWLFDDPAGMEGSEDEQLEKFKQVRNEIDEKVKAWVSEYRSSLSEN